VVRGQHWAYEAIETLAAHGLVAGVGGNQFAPDRPINRAQMATLINRAMPELGEQAWRGIPRDQQNLQRRELSRLLYELLKQRLGLQPVDQGDRQGSQPQGG
jgi:hypothetical protein